MSLNYRFGHIEVRFAERSLIVDGKPVALGRRAFDVLQVLIEHRARVVTKDELLNLAWPGLVVEESNLPVHVSSLRKLLGPEAIETVPGRGYRFALSESQGAALSILVLPFINRTGDAQREYFVDGITESVTHDLSRIRDAFVIGPATAFAYRDKQLSVRQLGSELGVRYVLQGSVQIHGNSIRINAFLMDAMTDAQLWSDVFEAENTDLFALQDLVTTRIGNSIGHQLVIAAARDAETRKSSYKVTDLLLRARALETRSQCMNNQEQIEALYREVLAAEPNNMAAVAGLAYAITTQAYNFGSSMQAEVREAKYSEGHALAQRAQAADPDNPRIYTILGLYASAHHDLPGRLRADLRRLELEPKNPHSYYQLGATYLQRAEPAKAIEMTRHGMNLSPGHIEDAVLVNLGEMYFQMGQYGEAIDWLERAVQKNPGLAEPRAYLVLAHTLFGQTAQAQAVLTDLRRLDANYSLPEQDKPNNSSPPAYRDYWENTVLTTARRAGLLV